MNLNLNTISPIISDLPSNFNGKVFKNFATNGELEKKKKHCIDFAKGLKDKNSLMLCGAVGNGKTHLAVAVARNFRKNKTFFEHQKTIRPKIQFLNADEFFMTLNDKASQGKGKLEYIKELFTKNDLIILDDLGISNLTPAKQENLFVFLNRAYNYNRSIIITTNFTLEALENIDARISSRLNEMAFIIEFNFEDFRLKNAS
jgi:DNA replication protein DnaC